MNRADGQNLDTASSASARSAAALCELARQHLEAGKALDAQLCCQQALEADPGSADAMHLMGQLSLRADQNDHAIEWFARAIRQNPKPAFLLSLGHALKRQGRLEDAFRAFDKAVELDIDSAEAWKLLAEILADLNHVHEAALAFQHVLKLDPRDADAAHQAARLLVQSGKPEEALALLDRADQLRPQHAPTLKSRALALIGLERFEEAAAVLRSAHALAGHDADICNDMGVILRRLGRLEEALIWFNRALALGAGVKTALSKGYALERLHRFDEALAIYADVKRTDPGNADAELNAALLHLMAGHFEDGWAGREARWKVRAGVSVARYEFPGPMWLGREPIAGKTILIYQDEGLGDVVQFARYVPMVAALGARIILLVDDALAPLLSGLPGVAECVPRSARRNVTFDVHCAITSLALAFNTTLETIPATVPYLPAPDETRRQIWEQRLGPHDKMRVGLVWSGNAKQWNDPSRSTTLATLLPLLELDATFISLQKDPRPADRATLRERPDIIDLTEHLTDFVETAALMSCCDLIISVCTGPAHLAGAMARPTWIMLCYEADWRWMLDRDDSPWYPTLRLFRQSENRDYAEVVARMRAELGTRIAAWRAPAMSDAPAGDIVFHDADAACQAAFTLLRSGKPAEALALLDRSDQLRPDHAPTLHARALVLQVLGHFDEALVAMDRAHALASDDAEICNDMGALMQRLGRQEEALHWFERALQRRRDFGSALNNKLHLLLGLHRFDEALAIYAAQKAARPDDPEPDWNAALIRLRLGDFEHGWTLREARWRMPNLPLVRPNFPTPMWLGQEPIAGKTILVFQDEGLGDAIHFARYVPMLAGLGARVILAVNDPLLPLLSKLPGVAAVVPRLANEQLAFDVYCAIGSLPLAFGTRLDTIPSAVPYLPAPDQARVAAWEQRLGPHDKMRVGLVWSGNAKYRDDQIRSLSFRALIPLLDLDASFVSLQKELRPDDQAALRERPDIIDCTAELTDFAETAALMSCLDLVISVDTSTAHLAGALARPAWVLLPHTPDYRWMLGRDDSPWYPTLRLFRQSESRDYAAVVARMRGELSALIEARLAPMPAAVDDDADALHRKGLSFLAEGQHDLAVDLISRAIRRDPKPLYLTSLGTVLLVQARREEAVAVFDKAVQLKPDDANLWRNLALALADAGCTDDAILSLQQAVKLDPGHFDAAHRAALLLSQQERHEEALVYFNVCDELKPNDIQTVGLRSETLQMLRRYEEALADLERIHLLDPTNADARNQMGNCLVALGRYEEALSWYDRAFALRDKHAMRNKAIALEQLGRFDQALVTYRQAIAEHPNDVGAEWNLALLQLLTGDFEAGWAGREAARWNIPVLVEGYPKLSRPIWRGTEPIDGKTILVCPDEGLGDVIQFVRYVPMLAARGARVILIVQDELYPLLSKLPGVTQCLPRSATTAPPYDVHCPLTSLPLAFGTRLDTIRAETSYLPAPALDRVKAWEQRLGSHGRLRVGLVWSGNPRHPNDRNRSMPFRTLARILDADATFVSLQKDPRAEDRPALLERTDVIELTAHLTDFVETAALVSCLDLVISVDTSVAHLSAALGRPTWILLPYTPDYRWLLGRDDSPWYPTVRLFRQSESRDYAEVVARIRAELGAEIARWPERRKGD